MGRSSDTGRLFFIPPEQLRRVFLAVLGAVTVATVFWMSSVGILTPPHLLISKAASYLASPKNIKSRSEPVANISGVIDVNYVVDKLNAFGIGIADSLNGIMGGRKEIQSSPHSSLSVDQRLILINVFGTDRVNFNDLSLNDSLIVNLTLRRLEIRVTHRLARAGQYASNLNQTIPITNTTLYVSHVIIDGGLGNWMFMVGSTFGVARINHRRPSLLKDYWAEKAFTNFTIDKLNRTELLGNDSQDFFENAKIGEAGAGKFTQQMTNVSIVKGPRNVLLAGYLQSWKYFDDFRDDIRSLFTFSSDVFNASLRAIETKIANYMNETEVFLGHGRRPSPPTLPTLVGIHVRRGDILRPDQLKHGHRPATEEYLLRAALHFERIYPSVLFIVISNDNTYCKQLYKEPNFLFMENNPEAVDIAILSLMDHIILSVGTYGWWGAYLSDAKDVYYFSDWPRNGSSMETMFNKDEYFLPSWTPFE